MIPLKKNQSKIFNPVFKKKLFKKRFLLQILFSIDLIWKLKNFPNWSFSCIHLIVPYNFLRLVFFLLLHIANLPEKNRNWWKLFNFFAAWNYLFWPTVLCIVPMATVFPLHSCKGRHKVPHWPANDHIVEKC